MQTEPSQQLVYRCPVCHHDIDVDEGFVNETIQCPNPECGHSIKISAPRATLVGVSDPNQPDDRPDVQAAADNEEVLKVMHPSMLRQQPLKFLGLWLVVLGGTIGSFTALGYEQPLAAAAAGAAATAAGVVLLYWWVCVMATTLTISTRRTELRFGIIQKNTSDVQHDDVRNMQIDQNMMDRMLGVGTIKISSSGQDDLEIVAVGFRNPEEIAALIRQNQ
ncbi:Bacterial membrane flanked domain protein [Pirellulimonas nuda]|uniref:Bacterial membrane flanked domain protein n=1 Tax=Pirellulimonas nuda TaxID=2528009 RepID=A0A518DHP6_9BACT|nr:PH domain-containing protein [Pirellulimonas nuda]QDU91000.1 Bacterial membrane flanked domain protein [Pirellulimonas nuda]